VVLRPPLKPKRKTLLGPIVCPRVGRKDRDELSGVREREGECLEPRKDENLQGEGNREKFTEKGKREANARAEPREEKIIIGKSNFFEKDDGREPTRQYFVAEKTVELSRQ